MLLARAASITLVGSDERRSGHPTVEPFIKTSRTPVGIVPERAESGGSPRLATPFFAPHCTCPPYPPCRIIPRSWRW